MTLSFRFPVSLFFPLLFLFSLSFQCLFPFRFLIHVLYSYISYPSNKTRALYSLQRPWEFLRIDFNSQKFSFLFMQKLWNLIPETKWSTFLSSYPIQFSSFFSEIAICLLLSIFMSIIFIRYYYYYFTFSVGFYQKNWVLPHFRFVLGILKVSISIDFYAYCVVDIIILLFLCYLYLCKGWKSGW